MKRGVGGGGSMVFQNFSENSSVLVPSIEVAIGCTANCRASTQLINDRHKLEYSVNNRTRSAIDCAADCHL